MSNAPPRGFRLPLSHSLSLALAHYAGGQWTTFNRSLSLWTGGNEYRRMGLTTANRDMEYMQFKETVPRAYANLSDVTFLFQNGYHAQEMFDYAADLYQRQVSESAAGAAAPLLLTVRYAGLPIRRHAGPVPERRARRCNHLAAGTGRLRDCNVGPRAAQNGIADQDGRAAGNVGATAR